jgi:spore germination protein GerM
VRLRLVRGAPLLSAALLLSSCGGRREAAPERDSSTNAEASRPPEAGAQSESTFTPLPSVVVTLYFPSSGAGTLVGENREIFETASAVDRAKQILSEVISGPTSESAIASVPSGTRLRQVYVLEDGVAYADFSSELAGGIEGGSADEILAVYSIVDSLALNIPEIQRVAILIDGRQRATLAGHIDLRRPLAPDKSLLEGKAKG